MIEERKNVSKIWLAFAWCITWLIILPIFLFISPLKLIIDYSLALLGGIAPIFANPKERRYFKKELKSALEWIKRGW